jgi:hypothetical protein
MIVVFMGNKDGFYGGHGQPEPSHPPFGLAAGNAGVDQHGFPAIADIITVAIASGVERCDVKCHGLKGFF